MATLKRCTAHGIIPRRLTILYRLWYRAVHLKPSVRFRFRGEVPAVHQTPRLCPVRPRNSGAWIVWYKEYFATIFYKLVNYNIFYLWLRGETNRRQNQNRRHFGCVTQLLRTQYLRGSFDGIPTDFSFGLINFNAYSQFQFEWDWNKFKRTDNPVYMWQVRVWQVLWGWSMWLIRPHLMFDGFVPFCSW